MTGTTPPRDPADLLDRLGSGLPGGPPPLDELLRDGRASVRHRRRAAIAGSVVAALAVASGALVAPGLLGADEAAPPAPAGRDRTSGRAVDDPLPQAPDGTRFVGAGRTVLAVPTTWPVATQSCFGDETDYVYYDESLDPLFCRPDGAGQGDGTTVGVLGSRPDGVAAEATGPSAIDCTTDPRVCVATVAAPAVQTWLTVGASGPDAEQHVRDLLATYTRLPAGAVVVPQPRDGVANVVHDLRGSGLRVQQDPDVIDTRTLRLSPAEGTVVAAGSTVRLRASAPEIVADPAVIAPGTRELALRFPDGAARTRAYDLNRLPYGAGSGIATLLSSSRPGERARWIPLDEGAHWTDHVITGPGPDRLVLPPDLESGDYLACTSAEGVDSRSICATFTVSPADPS